MFKVAILAAAVMVFAVACAEKPAPTKARVEKDPKILSAEEKIGKTTADGKAIIEKVQAMKPEVNEVQSTKTLKEIVDGYAQNMGAYNITPIGWEASQKKTNNWKVVFHYQDYQKQVVAAEWEYNPGSSKVYPFEKVNAPGFISTEPAPSSAAKSK
jgi:hypothetical protein